tara:strand:+ start:24156 stop:28040 length:3885 start_codon:yes stop_codon:yes gene_type:complete
MKTANEDASNTANVILIYNGVSDPKSNSFGGGGTGTASTGWTREHIFPKSLANPSLGTSGSGADAHNLAPCTNSINGSRGNKRYEASSGSYGSVSTTGFYPGDDWRGDVARAIFYMDLRYSSQCDLNAVADLNLLLQWNAIDPVSSIEDQRNEEIYLVQGNRNPFIDNPIFATRIWGGPTAQNRFSVAIADPNSFSLSATNTSVSFSASANANSDNIMLAFKSSSGNFGVPSGTYSAGQSISGGGTVLYVGPANSIPDHINLNSGSVYQYKIWSLTSSNAYSAGLKKSISTLGGAQAVSQFQNSFENTSADNWTYTTSPAAYNFNSDLWDTVRTNGTINSGSEGAVFWGIRDLNNTNGGGNFYHELNFQTINISGLSNVELSFDYYAEAFESSDVLEYELTLDGSSGGSNVVFVGGTGGLSSTGWQEIKVSIPAGTNSLSLKLRAKQDGGTDYAGFDNIRISSSLSPPSLVLTNYSPTAIQAQVNGNAANDSILLVYAQGNLSAFPTASGIYSVGGTFEGQATVAYFGPANQNTIITHLSESETYSFAAFSFSANSYSDATISRSTLPSSGSSGMETLFQQDFEGGSAANLWTIVNGAANISSDLGTADFPPNERVRSGLASWQVNNSNTTLELASVNVNPTDSIFLNLHLSSTALTSGNGADGSDEVAIYLNINGNGFSSSPNLIITGNNNAKWGFGNYQAGTTTNTASGTIVFDNTSNQNLSPNGGGYREADAYQEINAKFYNINSIAIKITAINNSANEIWNIDDITLTAQANNLIWNGAEWKNNNIPSSSSAAFNLIVYPGDEAEINTGAKVSHLDIRRNASLRVNSLASLEISAIDSINGQLILGADNLGSATYIGPSISLRKEYYLDRDGWHSIAFPFSNARFREMEFTNNGRISYASAAGESDCSSCNLFYYDNDITNSENIGNSGSSAFGTWIAVHDSNAIINSQRGYYLYLGAPNFGETPLILSLEGITKNGNQSLQTQDGNGGWNLIANPFTSALDWSTKSDLISQGFDQAYWVYNGTNFATYLNGIGINGADGYIANGQAFFVHAANPLTGAQRQARSFNAYTSMRSANNRRVHKGNQDPLIRLEISNDRGDYSEAALSLNLLHSNSFDNTEDALAAAMLEDAAFHFLSSDGRPVSINAAQLKDEPMYFPVHAGLAYADGAQLKLSGPDQYFYYLLNEKGEIKPINAQADTLLQQMSTNLQLVISKHKLQLEGFDFYWYHNEAGLQIRSLQAYDNLRLFNLQGQLIYQSEKLESQSTISALQGGFYILELDFGDNRISEKIAF